MCTFNDVYAALKYINPEISIERLEKVVTDLKGLHLLYCDAALSNIITVVDVD